MIQSRFTRLWLGRGSWLARFAMNSNQNGVLSSRYRVFLSHGSGDTFIVKELLQPKLEASGAVVFVDTEKISYGDRYREIIIEELTKCDELLVLITVSSLRRPWIFAEVGATLVRQKRIVVILYGPSLQTLQKLGILSLINQYKLLQLNDFYDYVDQLTTRVTEHSN